VLEVKKKSFLRRRFVFIVGIEGKASKVDRNNISKKNVDLTT
jgi:hypothetical protein